MKRQLGKRMGTVFAALLAAAMMTACGGENAAGQMQEGSGAESTMEDGGSLENGTAQENGPDAETLNGETMSADEGEKEAADGQGAFYDGADLEGSVAELTPEGFLMTPAKVWGEDGGEIMATPVSGAGTETVPVVYTADTVFETAHMDLAAAAETGRETSEKESVSAEDSVCVFGTQNGDGSWTAEKVLILDWQ